MPDSLFALFSNIWSVVLVILFFGGSIFVHELGHFLAALWRGLHVDRFSIGFGPKIFGWTRKGVEYRLSWLPFGGYVALPQLADMQQIEGDAGVDVRELPPISYTDKMIVSVAGAVFNVIFAFLLATVLFITKQPVSGDMQSRTIGWVSATVDVRQADGTSKEVPSPAKEAGLMIGDEILAIDGRSVSDWNDVMHAIITGSGRSEDGRRRAEFRIRRNGDELTKTLHPQAVGDEQLRQVGISPLFDVFIALVPPGSLAEAAGMKPKDKLVSIGGTPVTGVAAYQNVLRTRAAEPLDLVVEREGATVHLTVPARPHPRVTGLVRDSLAQQVGIRFGDELVAIDDVPMTDAAAVLAAIRARTEVSFKLTVGRDGQTIDLTVPARPDGQILGIEFGQWLGEIPTANVEWVRIGPVEQCVTVVSESYHMLTSLLNPRSDVRLSLLSGPIEIVRVYHAVAQSGLWQVMKFTLLINIGLAVFNVLPIPVLDGGHMVFATISKLRGRPIPINVLATVQSVFMVLLLTMFIYVSYYNIRRWVRDAEQSRTEQSIIRDSEEATPPPGAPATPAP